MQFSKSVVGFLIALASACLLGSGPPLAPNPDVVARVGDDYAITFADLQKYVQDRYLHLRYSDQAEAYEYALDNMIMDRLKQMDFFASGLHRDSALTQRIQRRITEEMVVRYFQTEHLEEYVNEEAIRKAYEKMKREVIYRQIVLPKPPADTSSQEIDSLKTTVTKIRSLIDEGEDFGTLVDRFSRIGASAQQGGYAEPVTWSESLSSPLGRVVFNLDVGEVRTLETKKAFKIVRVEEYRDREVAPLEEVRGEIARKLRENNTQKAYEAFEREKKETVERSDLNWDEQGIEQVVAWANTPNFFEEDYQETLRQAIENGENFTILTYPQGEVDVRKYLELLNDVLIMDRSGSHDAEEVKSFLVEALRTKSIADKARKLGLKAEIMQTNTSNAVLRGQIVRLYNQRFIEEKIPAASEEALAAFYEAHKDSLFYQLSVVRIFAIIRSDKEKAEQLWTQHEEGVAFNELAHRKEVRSFVRDREGNITSHKSKEKAYLGEEAFQLREGEVRGPISYQHPEKGTQYAMIKVTSRRPEKQLSFREAKEKVAEEFTTHHREKIKVAVKEKLWSKYPVTVNRDVLNQHLTAL